MFKYEIHLHSSGCSACGAATSVQLVDAAKEKGYAGVVFTNHFFHGNSFVDRNLPWDQFVGAYKEDWLMAKEEGDRVDMDVLFGLEEVYENGKEILIYGIEAELIAEHPEFMNMNVYEMSDLIRSNGGFVACAHPFRARWYIPDPNTEPDPAFMDAVEVYNYGNEPWMDEKALAYAKKYHLPQISGGDVHYVSQIGNNGLAFYQRIRNNEQLVQALKSGQYKLIVNGEILDE